MQVQRRRDGEGALRGRSLLAETPSTRQWGTRLYANDASAPTGQQGSEPQAKCCGGTAETGDSHRSPDRCGVSQPVPSDSTGILQPQVREQHRQPDKLLVTLHLICHPSFDFIYSGICIPTSAVRRLVTRRSSAPFEFWFSSGPLNTSPSPISYVLDAGRRCSQRETRKRLDSAAAWNTHFIKASHEHTTGTHNFLLRSPAYTPNTPDLVQIGPATTTSKDGVSSRYLPLRCNCLLVLHQLTFPKCSQILQMALRAVSSHLAAHRREPHPRIRLSLPRHEWYHP